MTETDKDRDNKDRDNPGHDPGAGPGHGLYHRLLADLDAAGAAYRLLDHPAEGRTELVSALRGHPVAHAAKCMILMVKVGKQTRYVLAVVPGDTRVDLAAVKDLLGASYVSIAAPDKAEDLAGSVSGTVLPISYHPQLELIAAPALLGAPELYFNAARLDRSLAVRTADWAALAQPRLAEIISR